MTRKKTNGERNWVYSRQKNASCVVLVVATQGSQVAGLFLVKSCVCLFVCVCGVAIHGVRHLIYTLLKQITLKVKLNIK